MKFVVSLMLNTTLRYMLCCWREQKGNSIVTPISHMFRFYTFNFDSLTIFQSPTSSVSQVKWPLTEAINTSWNGLIKFKFHLSHLLLTQCLTKYPTWRTRQDRGSRWHLVQMSGPLTVYWQCIRITKEDYSMRSKHSFWKWGECT